MAQSKLIRTTCKGCGLKGHSHEGAFPETVTYKVTKRGKAPVGMRMQAWGAAASAGLSGADKGGYAKQAEANRRPDKGELLCVRCGGDRIATEVIRVPTDEAIRLLQQGSSSAQLVTPIDNEPRQSSGPSAGIEFWSRVGAFHQRHWRIIWAIFFTIAPVSFIGQDDMYGDSVVLNVLKFIGAWIGCWIVAAVLWSLHYRHRGQSSSGADQ